MTRKKKKKRDKTMENNTEHKDKEQVFKEEITDKSKAHKHRQPVQKEAVKQTLNDEKETDEQAVNSIKPELPKEPQLSEINKLNNQIEQLAKESAAYKDRWLRAEADMDNYRKRVHKEKLEQLKYGYETLLRELLIVIDNLERAVEYSKKHLQQDSLHEGVELTLKLLKKVMEGYGVTTVQTVGQIFDPNFHEGLGIEEGENYEDNIIVKEVEKGYIYNDRLLRPAKVIVGKKSLPPPSGEVTSEPSNEQEDISGKEN